MNMVYSICHIHRGKLSALVVTLYALHISKFIEKYVSAGLRQSKAASFVAGNK